VNIKIKLRIILFLCFLLINYANAAEIIVNGSIDELYDDNINSSSTNPESDWITSMTLGVTARSELRQLDVNLSGNINQRYSVKHEESNANYQDMMISINKSFSENVSLSITDSLQHYPESKSFSTLFGRSEENTGYLSNSFSSNLTVYVSKEIFLGGVYTYSTMNNDSNTIPDSVLHNPGGNIGYIFNSANTVRVGYLYTLMKYNNDSHSRGDRGYIEYVKLFTPQLQSVLQGGYDYITTEDGQRLSSMYMFSLIDDIDNKNQMNITYIKENTISNISNDIFENWRVEGSLRREINERTRISMSLFYGQGTYQLSRVTEKLRGASAALAFTVTEFLSFTFGYTYVWRNSIAPASGETAYNRNQYSIGLSAVY